VTAAGSTRPTGPWWVAAGLALVVSVNLTMVAIAVGHPSAPATDDHWMEALSWDSELARRTAARELGWKVTMEPCVPGADGTCHVAFRVLDRTGRPVGNVSGTLQLRRADDARHDRSVELAPSASGTCTGPLVALPPGTYELGIELRSPEHTWVGRDRRSLRGQP
jgi:nitrogen fixation protein FixH